MIMRFFQSITKPTAPPIAPSSAPSLSIPVADSDGAYPILPASSLFDATRTNTQIKSLRELTGFPPEQFSLLVQQPLSTFAEYVQLLPASEAHHHAHAGGLLQHTIEVLVIGLQLRRARLLPAGEPEKMLIESHRWTLAVFAAILLHDIGKIITDQHIELIYADGRREPWAPLGKPMTQSQAKRYAMTFRAKRDYKSHQLAGMSMLSLLFTDEARAFLTASTDIMEALTGVCTDDSKKAGIVGNILREADMASTSSGIASTSITAAMPAVASTQQHQQIAGASVAPLIDRLVQGIRLMILEDFVPINKAGACAFFKDGCLYLIVPEAINKLREVLAEKQIKVTEKNNNHLYDALAGGQVAIATEADRAIHNLHFATKNLNTDLRCLKLDGQKIFGDGRKPAELDGEVTDGTPVSAKPAAAAKTSTAVEEKSEGNPAARKPPPITIVHKPQKKKQEHFARQPAKALAKSAAAVAPKPHLAPPPAPKSAAAAAADVPRVTIPEGFSGLANMPNLTLDDNVIALLTWLTTSLSTKKIKHNAAGAPVHFINGGDMFLVSPAIFRAFAKIAGAGDEWKPIQNSLRYSGLCKAQFGGKQFLHTLSVVTSKSNGLSSAALTGLIIKRDYVARILSTIPKDNPVLIQKGNYSSLIK